MAEAEIELVQPGRRIALGRVGGAGRCPVDLVDDLARLQLVLGRYGWRLRVRQVSDDARSLIELAGLGEVLRADRPSSSPDAPHGEDDAPR